MRHWRIKPQYYVIGAAISFLVAAVSFSGLVLGDARWARLIMGAIWSVIGIGWLSRYYYVRLKAREGEIRDLRESLLARARDTAAQQERNRLARELHDSIKQQIFSISMGAAAAEARWDTDPQGAQDALAEVRRSAQEAMAEMNALLQQLSPAPLEKVGLVQALRDQCEALGYRTDAEVAAQFGPLPADDRFPSGAQEGIFRITQEAFSNVARHARAEHVRLYLGQPDSRRPLTLEVQDDGQGFALDAAQGGMGLENIRQRVSALGGTLALESTPGQGTRLRVQLPLVEPTVSPAEASQRHTLNKVFLTGLIGGLALIAALIYPLAVLVPGRFVAGWPTGSAAIGLLLEMVALLLVGGTGALAARWAKASTRWSGTLFGAVAGAVAGAVLFFGIGAATTAMVGGADLLEHGPVPAPGQTVAIRLLAEATARIVGWSHGAFWTVLLAGTGLGALGGLLAPPTLTPSRRPDQRLAIPMILTTGVLASAISLLTAVRRFAVLEPTIRAGLVLNNVSLETTFPLERVSDWLVGTPMLLYVAALVAAYFPLRAAIKKTEEATWLATLKALAAVLTLVAFGLPVYLGFTGFPTLSRGPVVLPRGWMDVTGLPHPPPATLGDTVGAPLLITGLVCSLSLGGLYLGAMGTAHRRQRAEGASTTVQAVLRLVLAQSIGASMAVVVAMVIPPMTVISTVVGMRLITNQLVERLMGYEAAAQGFSLVDFVRSAFVNQATSFLITFVVAAAVTGLLALVISGSMGIPEQWER